MKDMGEANSGKFIDPELTADGSPRARVALTDPQTLWFNTGTLCNIECRNCYIESSPTNDALVYLTADEVSAYLDQLEARRWQVREIGFTGGEPFMNTEMVEMARRSLARGYDVLILTNAMLPMMRPRVRDGLRALQAEYGAKLTLRISVDHWSERLHDVERGRGSFAHTLRGMRWLRDVGIRMAVAGRSVWGESEEDARAGYARLYAENDFDIDAQDPGMTVIFPEMDDTSEVPEITTACWDILGKSPRSVMCATSRMVVKHKGAATPSVAACTLLPYDSAFDLGKTLADAERDVALNHPHCAKFCVLGGASCSA
ncbi:4Fe-4S single cluster protein [Aliiruegeria haliotis]|uniref:4Fe-4S single cluster protein n=1 Tax=Aliiruegeria haliotis TaxID=1280846 RepID=A0A2T0RJZ9_9RHOB|nr:radical SAM protein [Aliiruegeria haliotis]PRY21447.1 4Fe-4S single cluster protein [Aliiruegeria haliotis]